MTTLRQALQRVPPGREFLVGERATRTFGDVANLHWSQHFVPRAVALTCEISETALPILAALDGAVDRVYLGPQTPATGVVEVDCVAAALDHVVSSAGRTDWVFRTSGTSGPPASLAKASDSLLPSRKVAAGEVPRWGLLYDWWRFAGIQVFLEAAASGSSLICPAPGDLARRALVLQEQRCTHLSATPSLWRRLLTAQPSGWTNLRQITLGGEVVDQQILNGLRRAAPAARITHIYASTEVGPVISVQDGEAGFPVSFLNHNPSGPPLAIDDGELLVQPAGTEPQWFRTGDLVEVAGDRVLFVGRSSSVINVGGEKVQPEMVERVLLETPGIFAARVLGTASSTLGSIVSADIVVLQGLDPQVVRQAAVAHCRSRLPRHAVPARWRFVEELDVTRAGKIARA